MVYTMGSNMLLPANGHMVLLPEKFCGAPTWIHGLNEKNVCCSSKAIGPVP